MQYLEQMTCAEAGRLGGLKGGKAKSEAKTKAAQANAKKGGWRNRPKPADERAADIVAKNPTMLKDAIKNTLALNRANQIKTP